MERGCCGTHAGSTWDAGGKLKGQEAGGARPPSEKERLWERGGRLEESQLWLHSPNGG